MLEKKYQAADIAAMREAVKMSATSTQHPQNPEGGPFGAVICKDGKVIAAGCNHVLINNDPSAHAEVFTIREACRNLGTWDLSGCTLYTSCEPCPMCLMTAKWANISQIYFAATRKDAAAIGFRDDDLYNLLKPAVFGTMIEECHDEAVAVMQKWRQTFGNDEHY